MTSPAPLFTVVMATWGRGRHVAPSIRSVLQQEFRDFELLVIGDACDDDTEAAVAGFHDPRLRWINLADRIGSQSGPNNAGIAAARGQIIAYLGHDDIWEPNHLSAIARQFSGDEAPDFVVSGLIAHPPAGAPFKFVMGLFTDDSAKHDYFFPPSCFAHRRKVVDRIGNWKMPKAVREPVDQEFLTRATVADLRFVSTGVVTVHKFTATFRYLCYLQQESDEQEDMLAEIALPGHVERVAALVTDAKRQGTFMSERKRNFEGRKAGELFRQNAARRGVERQRVRPLGKGAVIRQRPDYCAYDWQGRPTLGIRLRRLNLRPKFSLPFSGPGRAVLTIRVVHPHQEAFGALSLLCNGVPVTAQPFGVRRSLWGWTAKYEAVIRLSDDGPSLLTFLLDKAQLRTLEFGPVSIGFGIGRILLRPIPEA